MFVGSVYFSIKLKFMWGNLALESREQKEVAVPFLKPGEVGVVSVAFVAPILEGTYTSHWRLAHCGVQFGPRVWCSIVVVPSSGQKTSSHCSKSLMNKPNMLGIEGMCWSGSRNCETQVSSSCQREYYIPSVDLLTAQDLLSFELLDINIVQELEKVPANTPVDMTPCMSPVPHYGPVFGKHGLGPVKPDSEHTRSKKLQVVQPQRHVENVDAQAHEDGDDDISGTQFVCETVIRSLTLEEEPEHKPRRQARTSHGRPEVHDPSTCNERYLMERIDRPFLPIVKRPEAPPPVQPPALLEEPVITVFSEALIGSNENLYTDPAALDEEEGKKEDLDKDEEAGEWDEVSSQASSSSSEEYIVVLPDCFDTSKPLADSMYSSAMSQPGTTCTGEPEGALDQSTAEGETSEPTPSIQNSVNRLLCTSQVLNTPALVPEVVPVSLSPPPTIRTHRSIKPCETENRPQETEENNSSPPEDNPDGLTSTHMEGPTSAFDTCNSEDPRLRQGGLTEGLVKGALSVAASAYKALFTGQSSSTQRPSADPACEEAQLIAVLQEMGFGDKLLNQKLLRKHQYNLLDVVNELVQMTDNEWYTTRH